MFKSKIDKLEALSYKNKLRAYKNKELCTIKNKKIK
jgi:hypothetical protein